MNWSKDWFSCPAAAAETSRKTSLLTRLVFLPGRSCGDKQSGRQRGDENEPSGNPMSQHVTRSARWLMRPHPAKQLLLHGPLVDAEPLSYNPFSGAPCQPANSGAGKVLNCSGKSFEGYVPCLAASPTQ